MNPRRTAKADSYILALKGILHTKPYNLANKKRLERQAFIKFMKGL